MQVSTHSLNLEISYMFKYGHKAEVFERPKQRTKTKAAVLRSAAFVCYSHKLSFLCFTTLNDLHANLDLKQFTFSSYPDSNSSTSFRVIFDIAPTINSFSFKDSEKSKK